MTFKNLRNASTLLRLNSYQLPDDVVTVKIVR